MKYKDLLRQAGRQAGQHVSCWNLPVDLRSKLPTSTHISLDFLSSLSRSYCDLEVSGGIGGLGRWRWRETSGDNRAMIVVNVGDQLRLVM